MIFMIRIFRIFTIIAIAHYLNSIFDNLDVQLYLI